MSRTLWTITAGLIACAGVAAAMTRTIASDPTDCVGGRSLDAGCFVDRYTEMTRGAGAEAALADLAERRDASPFVAAACHQLTHVVGRTAGRRHGKAAFDEGTDLCASGYYHGVTESVMESIGRERILDRAMTVCADQREQERYSYRHYNCVHGMGHGFMSVFDSDVFQSLPGCDRLADPWEQHHCYGGVFMENLSAFQHLSRPSKHLRPHDPLYPCASVDDRYKTECYLEQTAYALFVRNDDFGAVFRLCQDEAAPPFRAACYEGLGGDAAIKASKYVIGERAQADTLRALCLEAPNDEARLHCVIGAVTTIVTDLSGVDRQARSLCEALGKHPLATVCETTRASAVRSFPETEGGHHH